MEFKQQIPFGPDESIYTKGLIIKKTCQTISLESLYLMLL